MGREVAALKVHRRHLLALALSQRRAEVADRVVLRRRELEVPAVVEAPLAALRARQEQPVKVMTAAMRNLEVIVVVAAVARALLDKLERHPTRVMAATG